MEPFKWEDLHDKTLKIYVAKDDYHKNRRYVFGINQETKVCYLLFEENFSEKQIEQKESDE